MQQQANLATGGKLEYWIRLVGPATPADRLVYGTSQRGKAVDSPLRGLAANKAGQSWCDYLMVALLPRERRLDPGEFYPLDAGRAGVDQPLQVGIDVHAIGKSIRRGAIEVGVCLPGMQQVGESGLVGEARSAVAAGGAPCEV